MNVLAVPSPTFGVVPGTMRQVRSPDSMNGPPAGRMPAGRLASNSVSPRGGAPTMVVPVAPMVGGPSIGVSLVCTGVPVTV